jgi:hypothetical protein
MKVYVVTTWPDYETGEVLGVRRSPELAQDLAASHAFRSGAVIASWEHLEGSSTWTARVRRLYNYEVAEHETQPI